MKSMLKSLMSVAAAALALTSCSNDATEEVTIKGEPKTLEVNATIEQTRTTLAANHINLEWSEYDEILLYIGETATEPNIINPVSGSTVKATYNEDDNVYAKYSLDKSSSNGVTQAEINIVAEQTQSAANVFAGENLPMVAKGKIENGQVDLRFSPVGCVLVFNAYDIYGLATSEKVKSIKFETSVGCCGSQLCDLTADDLGYSASVDNKSVTVTLDDPAPIGAAKPENTRIGENQVYMVVAQVNYPAGSKFIVTTNNGITYTFTTANGIDCSTNTARVVNLNLANALKIQPTIEVPTVPQQSPDGGPLYICDIVFRNFPDGAVGNAEAKVYSDAKLTQSLENSWLTISSNATATLAKGQLNCQVEANGTTEDRTLYIGIKCGSVQAAIAVTQTAQGGVLTDKYFVKVTEDLADWTGDYLIVYEAEALALDGSLSKIDVVDNYKKVTITEQGILSGVDPILNVDTNSLLVKISKIEGGYILQTASGYYLYSLGRSNLLTFGTSYDTAAQHLNTISIEGGSAKITCGGFILRFNNTSPKRFRYYESGQKEPIQLYKLQK